MQVAPATAIRPFAVVTGSSSGIGLSLAKEFARRGYDLLITSEHGTLDDAQRQIESLGGGRVVAKVQADLATERGVDELYLAIKQTERPVDVIALNAGVGLDGHFAGGGDGPRPEPTELDKELRMIQLNVVSVVHLAKHVLNDMVRRGKGHVLITSSIAAITPTPFEAIYGATKAFLKSFAESLHAELEPKGITVTALQPGPTETNFFHRANMDDTKIGAGKKDNPDDVARQGIEALFAGKSHIVAGSLKTKGEGALMENVLPESTKANLHKSMAAPGSAK